MNEPTASDYEEGSRVSQDVIILPGRAPRRPEQEQPKLKTVVKRKDPITQKFKRIEVDLTDRQTGTRRFEDLWKKT